MFWDHDRFRFLLMIHGELFQLILSMQGFHTGFSHARNFEEFHSTVGDDQDMRDSRVQHHTESDTERWDSPTRTALQEFLSKGMELR